MPTFTPKTCDDKRQRLSISVTRPQAHRPEHDARPFVLLSPYRVQSARGTMTSCGLHHEPVR